MKLSEINSDIFYLLNGFSFGAKKEKQVYVENPNKNISICNLNVKLYYYPSYISNKDINIFTPYGFHLTKPSEYEGQHHEYSKINDSKYIKYTFNEIGIYDGTRFIYKIDEDQTLPSKINNDMLAALIVTLHQSLYERLYHYVSLLEKDHIIDYGHVHAGYVTKNKIDKLLNFISDEKIKNCANDYLKNNKFNIDFIMELFDELKNFNKDKDRERLNYVNEAFNSKYNDLPFDKKPPPFVEIKGKKLF